MLKNYLNLQKIPFLMSTTKNVLKYNKKVSFRKLFTFENVVLPKASWAKMKWDNSTCFQIFKEPVLDEGEQTGLRCNLTPLASFALICEKHQLSMTWIEIKMDMKAVWQ